MSRVRRSSRRRGVAAVEMAVVLPLIMILLLGTWEVGRMLEVNNILDNAVREGGRQASSGYFSAAECQQVVIDYVKAAGLNASNVTVTVDNLTAPGVDPKQAAQMDEFRVRLTMPFEDVRWVALYLVTNSGSALNAESHWYSLRDRDYPNIPDPPLE